MGFHEPKWPLLESTKMFKVGSEFDPPMIPKGSPREPKGFQNESSVDPLKIHDGSKKEPLWILKVDPPTAEPARQDPRRVPRGTKLGSARIQGGSAKEPG